eukprot:1150765-Pelagomonas_calceolata.AAC.2
MCARQISGAALNMHQSLLPHSPVPQCCPSTDPAQALSCAGIKILVICCTGCGSLRLINTPEFSFPCAGFRRLLWAVPVKTLLQCPCCDLGYAAVLPLDQNSAVNAQALEDSCGRRLVQLFGDVHAVISDVRLRDSFCESLSLPAVKLWAASDQLTVDSENSVTVLLTFWVYSLKGLTVSSLVPEMYGLKGFAGFSLLCVRCTHPTARGSCFPVLEVYGPNSSRLLFSCAPGVWPQRLNLHPPRLQSATWPDTDQAFEHQLPAGCLAAHALVPVCAYVCCVRVSLHESRI